MCALPAPAPLPYPLFDGPLPYPLLDVLAPRPPPPFSMQPPPPSQCNPPPPGATRTHTPLFLGARAPRDTHTLALPPSPFSMLALPAPPPPGPSPLLEAHDSFPAVVCPILQPAGSHGGGPSHCSTVRSICQCQSATAAAQVWRCSRTAGGTFPRLLQQSDCSLC